MFNDETEQVRKQVENLLGTYDLEDIFEMNDVTAAEMLAVLYLNGIIDLPNMKPLTYDA